MTIDAQIKPSLWKMLVLIPLSPSKFLEQLSVGLLPLSEPSPPPSCRRSLDSGRLQGMGQPEMLQNLSATPLRMYKNVTNNLHGFQTFPKLKRNNQATQRPPERKSALQTWFDGFVLTPQNLSAPLTRSSHSGGATEKPRGRYFILEMKGKSGGSFKSFSRRSGILAACSKPSLAQLQGCVIPAIRVPRWLGPPSLSCSFSKCKTSFL